MMRSTFGITGRDMGQVANRTEVGEELELLAQSDVDAGKSFADRRSYRPFQRNVGAFDRLDQFLGNVFVILLKGLGARLKNFPFELEAGRFQNANRGLGDFRANAVAGDESDLVSHKFI